MNAIGTESSGSAAASMPPKVRGKFSSAACMRMWRSTRGVSAGWTDTLHRVGRVYGDGARAALRGRGGRYQPRAATLCRTAFRGPAASRGTAERFMAFGRSFAPLVGWWPSRLRNFSTSRIRRTDELLDAPSRHAAIQDAPSTACSR